MNCTKCGTAIAEGVKFCPECGAKANANLSCSDCGTELKAGVKFCPECGLKRGAESGEKPAQAADMVLVCKCGAVPKEGKKFCQKCGEDISKTGVMKPKAEISAANKAAAKKAFEEGNKYKPCLFSEKDDLDNAIIKYTEAIELDPQYVDAFLARGNSYCWRGLGLKSGFESDNDYVLAISDCNKAIELDPDKAEAYFARGECYRITEQSELAINDYSKAIELDPNSDKLVLWYTNRVCIYIDLGQKNLVISDLEKILSLNPNDEWAKDRLRAIRRKK